MGWGYVAAVGAHGGSAIGRLATEFWSKGGNAFKGFSATGQNDQAGDPQLDAMFVKGRVEQDDNKRKAIVNDIQKYLAKAMYAIPRPGRAASLTAAWPALANWRVWQQPRPTTGSGSTRPRRPSGRRRPRTERLYLNQQLRWF